MENYKIIDMETFDRADYFQYFMSVGTLIEVTVKLDVTSAVRKCKSEAINIVDGYHVAMLFERLQKELF